MDIEAYFRSLSAECETLKNRVRMFIEDEHWPTDGEWKESVLRSIIRRSAPENITVGRGFVVSSDWQSSQIDVLLYDNTLPILYRDGDLAFITPSSCRAIIEVKSATNTTRFKEAAIKLADNAEAIRGACRHDIFAGIFAYESAPGSPDTYLEALQAAANGSGNRLIDHVALGPSRFVKFWPQRPENGAAAYLHWHLYQLHDMAAGYFVHNVIAAVCRDEFARNEAGWFPQNTKEAHLESALRFNGTQQGAPVEVEAA